MSFDTNLFHQIKVKGHSTCALFTVPKRYINLTYLSAGAQGIVVLVLLFEILRLSFVEFFKRFEITFVKNTNVCQI